MQTTPVQPVPSNAFVVVPDGGQMGTDPVGVEPVHVQPERPVELEIASANSHIADISVLDICPLVTATSSPKTKIKKAYKENIPISLKHE